MAGWAVRVWRGQAVESVHRASVAVVDVRGRLVARAGNPRFVSFLRSAAKPFQAIPLVTSGAADAFGITETELAIVAGSHNGQDVHVRTVEGILRKIGRSRADLKCGRHEPHHKPTAARLAGRYNELHHNCSGKHAGMLALAVHRGWDLAGYQGPDHPVQVAIRQVLAKTFGLRAPSIPIGVDGCGVPTFAAPLASAARAFARLSRPEAVPGPVGRALARVRDAMRAHPEMVAGEDRLDTRIMRATAGRVLVKAGAEAFYGASVLERGLGIALKIEDGATRAVGPTLGRVFSALGAMSAQESAGLDDLFRPVLRNDQGREIGRLEPVLRLTKRGQAGR